LYYSPDVAEIGERESANQISIKNSFMKKLVFTLFSSFTCLWSPLCCRDCWARL